MLNLHAIICSFLCTFAYIVLLLAYAAPYIHQQGAVCIYLLTFWKTKEKKMWQQSSMKGVDNVA
jgi:predicted PurR-regulated permease PerM